MSQTREEKKAALRQKIFVTACALIEDKGFDPVSVDDIVKAVGIAKGTFFNHFPTKAHILAQWYETVLATSLSPAATDLGPDALNALVSLALSPVELARKSPRLWRAKHEYAMSTPAIGECERRGDEAFGQALMKIIDHFHPHASSENKAHFCDLTLIVVTGSVRIGLVYETPTALETQIRQRLNALYKALLA